MIYFDNGATSWPKPESVYKAVDKCMREYCANPGRGGHAMSIASGMVVMEARENLTKLFNIKNPLNISFTKNATEALNIAIKGFLKKGDHVITSSMEHNSVMRPLKTLEKEGFIELTIIKGDDFGRIDPLDFQKVIKKNTKLIVTTLSSNVNGTILPVEEIGKIAKESGIEYLLDASQGAGSLQVDVEKIKCSMLAFPGHKGLLGPQGTGGLYVAEGVKLMPLMTGGTGSNSEIPFQPEIMPDALESGTLNTPGIAGLSTGCHFILDEGIDKILEHKANILKYIYEGLHDIKYINVYSLPNVKENSGIISLKMDEVDNSEIAYVLDKVYNIAIRSGLHCAPSAHETIGTLSSGLIRISPGYFNTLEEAELVIKAFQEISENL